MRVWFLTLLGALLLAGCSGSPTAPSDVVAGSFLRFTSAPGDFIGQGESRHYTVANARFRPVMDLNRTEGWRLDAAAPEGQQLGRRTYEGAIRWPFTFPTAPGFSFVGNGRGCNRLEARFVVRQLSFGSLGEVEKLDMIFVQHCDGASGPLTGELVIVEVGSG
jgi:hypothetical protein